MDGYIIEGYILNDATLAVYKDVVCRVNYISATGSIISSENFTIYEYIYNNESTSFKIKVNPPIATSFFTYEIVKSNSVK